eukprot:TRINITY_DN43067_c0_g1_i1.p1 TRINITY_DN43067_c0_g1~~TRINITY_DN43067_c0_g1_i1.p1  ORF type:complete len:157 (+),score=46.42 TRINITY_DN43067_c0_g1_i1:66-473(+)
MVVTGAVRSPMEKVDKLAWAANMREAQQELTTFNFSSKPVTYIGSNEFWHAPLTTISADLTPEPQPMVWGAVTECLLDSFMHIFENRNFVVFEPDGTLQWSSHMNLTAGKLHHRNSEHMTRRAMTYDEGLRKLFC